MVHDWVASAKRLLTALSCKKRLDKVPFFPLANEQMMTRITGKTVKEIYSTPEMYANASITSYEFLHADMLCLPTVYAGPSEGIAFAEANGREDLIRYFDYGTPLIKQGELCKTEEDIENLKIPDHGKIKLWNTTCEASNIIKDKTGFPQNMGLGIWSIVQLLRGVQAFRDMRKNPGLLLKLCEKVYESQMDAYHNWIKQVGVTPFIYFTGYAFNKTLMSFDDAMKYEGNFIKRMQDEVKVPFILHNCGMKPYFKEICREIKFQAVNGSHPLDIKYWVEFKEEFKKVAIMGANIDASRERLTGTPGDVELKVKENIQHLAPAGGYICAPVCELPWGVSMANIMAIPHAIEKYGKYPIEMPSI